MATQISMPSIEPFRLFLVFNELVEAKLAKGPNFQPAHVLDQLHIVTDPIERLTSAIETATLSRPLRRTASGQTEPPWWHSLRT